MTAAANAFVTCAEEGLLERAARWLGVVLHLPEDHAEAPSVLAPAAEGERVPLAPGAAATFRLARPLDIPSICDVRCAQSVEYWGIEPAPDELARFRAETEAHLVRTLNATVFIAFAEREGEVVSMSGLELSDRLPTLGGASGVQRTATVIACYTPPAHRGRGHMRRMLRGWSVVAPMLGIDALYLESGNDSMRHLAASLGYEHTSDRFRLLLGRGESIGSPELLSA